ncbi:MAG: hypothetical protein IKM31_09275, partial [Oscillospiraceae bacterium]|nr:hypothetical protein [Oscillospiraceae bacterium]
RRKVTEQQIVTFASGSRRQRLCLSGVLAAAAAALFLSIVRLRAKGGDSALCGERLKALP